MSMLLTSTDAPQKLGVEDLSELMRSVNEVTGRLQATHVALQGQVSQLQRELAEANAQLRRSRTLAALGEMAAGIAHEVRNPLGSIQLHAQLLAQDLADRPALATLCEKISRAVEGLDAIVRDVLLFSRQNRINPTPCTAGELIDRSLACCESLLAAGNVRVLRQADEENACRLEADVHLITQALGNVIRNAVEAMVESGSARRELKLSASRQSRRMQDGRRAQRIVLTVDDSGPGVLPEVVERMFNPFFTTRPSGTGLGLAIVHRIVDAHGGQVAVSDAPGPQCGARVELCLPLRVTSKPVSPDPSPIPEIHTRRTNGVILEQPA